MKKIVEVNRIEVIDWTLTSLEGRAFVKWEKENFKVSYALQDNGKTLKIFLVDLSNKTKEGSEL